MAYEIIYVCNSINNKNVRQGELNILEKHENQLFFEFGSDEMNKKKRFYNDIETLNKDFDALLKLKERENKTVKLVYEMNENIKKAYEEPEKIVEKEIKKETKKPQKEEKLDKYKIIKRKK
jgi:hypothetical protein